jgi:hypothetical protein
MQNEYGTHAVSAQCAAKHLSLKTCMRRTSGIRSYTHTSLDCWSCFWRDEYISTIGILDLFWTRAERQALTY